MSRGWELNLDREHFLASHWQQKPLFVRGAINNFTPPVSSDELAGLAMEDEVESRIIEGTDRDWQLQHGPFSEADYQRSKAWTLLVQAVDHYLPEVAALRSLVDFLPQWRVDDVMVSYAADGGSVGPHYDNYDVFLLQGEGQRLWKVGQYCDEHTSLLPHDELRILSEFHCREEHLLGPGDLLYLPPGVAHWGVAQGECTTFSIGFRAPRLNDMVSRWVDQLLDQIGPEQFYHDARSEPVSRPGEIRPRDLERVRAQVQAALDQASGERWFGELVTEPRYDTMPDDEYLAEARALLTAGPAQLELSPAAKLAWQQLNDGILVFANGDSCRFGGEVLDSLAQLCGEGRLAGAGLQQALERPACRELLDYLLDSGCIYVE